MAKGRKDSEQYTWIHDALAQVRRKDEEEVLPRSICEPQRNNETVANGHQNGPCSDQRCQMPVPGHYDARYETTDWRC